MVGSHADEVEGGEAVVRSRCEAMSRGVHAELQQYRAAQEQELAEVEAARGRSEAAEQRMRDLQRVLSRPLRLSAGSIAVSAKTGDGFEELRQMVVDAAFDKQAFPTFGSTQPGTYSAIHRKLLSAHTDESSVTWDDMQESAAGELRQWWLCVSSGRGCRLRQGWRRDDVRLEPEPRIGTRTCGAAPASGRLRYEPRACPRSLKTSESSCTLGC